MRAWVPVGLIAAFILVATSPATYIGVVGGGERPHPSAAISPPVPRTTTDSFDPLDPPWVYIRSAGARGDGVTDDTAAVQAAFTEAATSGRPVFCRSGIYLVSATLVLGTDFAGSPSAGRAACVVKFVGSGPAVMVTANPVQIQNLVLDLTANAHTGTGGLLLPDACVRCTFSSIRVEGPPNGVIPYLNYGIFLRGGGTGDRLTNISTEYATSAIIAGIGGNLFYQSTFDNIFAHHCGQTAGRACLEITGAVDTVMNSGIGGGGGFPGAPTRVPVRISGTDAEAIDIIATELIADAPHGTAVVIARPAHDVSVVTLIDVRLPVPARLASDVVTPPRVTRIATQESGAGPVGFISAAAPIAAFVPARDSGITLDGCSCTAVAGTVSFTTGAAAPDGAAPFGEIRFQRVYPQPPIVILSWNSDSAATAGVYVHSTSDQGVRLRSSHLQSRTRYVLSYQVIEQ
ncbi:MAG TPA: glycosyl hydrolase family 28-related protein [bacterium]|nr:glycosyl hydrolase family 28-related protein [bacterium]